VREVFLKRKNRTALIDGCVIYNGVVQPCLMRVCRVVRRFMGILNAVFAPYIMVYLLMYSLFRHFEVLLSSLVVPVFNRRLQIHPLRAIEVPGIWRASPPL